MAGLDELVNVWKNLKDVDLRHDREEALLPIKLVIVGRQGVGRHTIANQLRRDPQKPQSEIQSAILISDLESTDWMNSAELIILIVNSAASDINQERNLAKMWTKSGKKCLVYINNFDPSQNTPRDPNSLTWDMEQVISGSAIDINILQREFVPVVLKMLPNRQLALARQFPLFRIPVAHKLISDACFSNAVYSLSTGVAEVIPILDIPLNLADMIVITKAQAFLVYKLGLALGLSTRWEDYLAEFGSVIGGGFVWRQLSRLLIGLIPVWGIVPKVAVAYSGTYVVGHAILQWYLTGRHISRRELQALNTQALTKGKEIAQNLVARLPRPHISRIRFPIRKKKRTCPNCNKQNGPDALFCQYCGQSFQPALPDLDHGNDEK